MHIRISLPEQSLELLDARGMRLGWYPVSTARNGAGEEVGSLRTPRGRHCIRAKVGAGATANTIFVGRRPTGESWSPALAAQHPDRDWILTRILWLSGREPGFNRLGRVDTMRRYIYIHGVPDTVSLATPQSHGCIRMRNADIVELFDRVPVRTPVEIVEFSLREGDWTALADLALPVREQVFVMEQGVPPEIERDAQDATSRHLVALDSAGSPIGTGRLLPDGHVGRLAVRREWRGKGVGAALFERLLHLAARERLQRVVLHAQTHAEGFYARYGFVREGQEFDEAGLPHITMSRAL